MIYDLFSASEGYLMDAAMMCGCTERVVGAKEVIRNLRSVLSDLGVPTLSRHCRDFAIALDNFRLLRPTKFNRVVRAFSKLVDSRCDVEVGATECGSNTTTPTEHQ
jgi:hypothetical protein